MRNNLSVELAQAGSRRRASWGAVLAGVAVTLVVQLALGLLSIGIGASRLNPLDANQSLGGIGMGSGLWLVATTLVSVYAGAWVAGRLSGATRKLDSGLHGILSWAVATIAGTYLLASAVTGVVGGAANVLGTSLKAASSAASQGVSAVAPKVADAVGDKLGSLNIDLSEIKKEADKLLRDTGKKELQPETFRREADQAADEAKDVASRAAKNPDQADDEISVVIDKILGQGRDKLEAVDKDALVNVLTKRTSMNRDEASATVDRWQGLALQARDKAEEAKAKLADMADRGEQKARELADQGAKAAASAALWSFLALVLGGVVAAFGGAQAYLREEDLLVHAASATQEDYSRA